MYDKESNKELIVSLLQQILWSLNIVQKRFQNIKHAEDFLFTDEGLEKLDSICMQLINIGELLKNLDKISDSSLLINYPSVDWKKAKGIRDIISHHYFDIDAEIIYNVCADHLPDITKTISQIIKDIQK